MEGQLAQPWFAAGNVEWGQTPKMGSDSGSKGSDPGNAKMGSDSDSENGVRLRFQCGLAPLSQQLLERTVDRGHVAIGPDEQSGGRINEPNRGQLPFPIAGCSDHRHTFA